MASLAVAGAVAVASVLFTAAAAAAQGPRTAPALNDAEIAAAVVAANAADVEAGKLALSRSSNREVKAFAKTMITDHTALNEQAAALVAKLGVTPAPSEASRGLAASTVAERGRLATQEGAAFDRAYVSNEVAYHESVLETLDKALIPNAQNAELKALLVAVRPAFVAHLEHAKSLQSSLES